MEPRNTGILDLLTLMVVALFAVPIFGMLAALVALDFTHSLTVQVITVILVPLVAVMAFASRRGLSSGIGLRLALIAALCATMLLDLGWSGAPGA